MEEERKELILDDITLNYYEKGIGESLIFIHGNGLNSRVFSKMFNYFSKKYKVIAVDTRGHGLSNSGEIPYTIELLADDFIKFCDVKKIERASIIGYSDGANIALLIAKKRPELINKLVIISGNYTADGLKGWFKAFIGLYKIPFRLLKSYSKKARKNLWRINLMLKDIGIEKEDLEKIEKPTLVIHAKYDVISKKHTELIHKSIKGSIIKLINNSTHFNIIFKDKVLKTIEKFLLK